MISQSLPSRKTITVLVCFRSKDLFAKLFQGSVSLGAGRGYIKKSHPSLSARFALIPMAIDYVGTYLGLTVPQT